MSTMRFTFFFVSFFTLFAFSSFAQIVWEDAAEVASDQFGNNYPRVVLNAGNNPVVTWQGQSNMYFARWIGNGFSTPVQINPDSIEVQGGSWLGPDVAAKGDTIYCIYKDTPESDPDAHVWCVSSFDGGLTFNDPVRVSYLDGELSRFQTVTIDQAGNPVIGFMEMNHQFLETKWMVVRSNDAGQTFEPETLASGWSDPGSEACDCCPGQIVSKGNTVAMLYRDNDANIRDSWAGLSTDGGATFTSGMNIDQLEWSINGCPSTGPDGFIHEDTLYAVFMSAGTGAGKIYYSKTDLATNTAGTAQALGTSTSSGSQNYPRIDHHQNASAAVYQKYNMGNFGLIFHYGNSIAECLNANAEGDLIVEEDVSHPDVAVGSSTVFVVWQDNATGSVRYKKGNRGFLGVPSLDGNEAKTLIGVYDLIGRSTTIQPNKTLIYVYSDGSREKKIITDHN